MSEPAAHTSPYAEAFNAFEHDGAAADPSWLRELRREAFRSFEQQGFPIARRANEPWKYTDVRELAAARFALGPEQAPTDVGPLDLTPYDLPCPRVHLLVFVDGRYEPGLSTEPRTEAQQPTETIGKAGDGPVVGRIADAAAYGVPLVREHLAQHASRENSFAALNTAFLHDGAFVFIPDGVSVPEPIYLLFLSTGGGEPRVTHPRVLLVAGRDSSATVLQAFEATTGDTAFTNAVTEVVAGPGANLRLYRIQRESDASYHVGTTQITQYRDSRVASTTLDIGGGLVRHDQSVRLAEAGASVSLNGLYLGQDKRHVDNHTSIDHAVPDTSSNEVYKGVLAGESRAVFAGHVIVRPDAQRTSANQLNKNLLLSDQAEIDTQPQLEIFNDDVQCTHGAAVGQLDENALFYLKARGIGEEAARRLLVRGFVSEVIEAISDEAVRQYADGAIMTALGQE